MTKAHTYMLAGGLIAFIAVRLAVRGTLGASAQQTVGGVIY